ncbi:hypothetical protein [Geobacter sulfurreducens]|uniref:hypothetical protein n=1 Tax=Geobacter sulfurreducens TaxID=35554 RepID=UPI0020B6EC5A|nr:hypothetical protein [Geobacter sulfurreducens]UTG93642.1 hypothetical protein J8622_04770 [Geobacter sulfurreducens]
MKIRIEPKTWKDVLTVIVIAIIPSFAVMPFEKYIPETCIQIVSHYSSTLGYLLLCYEAKEVKIKHLAAVAVIVWLIMMATYSMMFWNLIGTKYTIKGIVGGGFISEAVSVVVGSVLYVTGRELRYYYKYYLKGRA